MTTIRYNCIGNPVYLPELPLEPPDDWWGDDEEPKCCGDCNACPCDIALFCRDFKEGEDDLRD